MLLSFCSQFTSIVNRVRNSSPITLCYSYRGWTPLTVFEGMLIYKNTTIFSGIKVVTFMNLHSSSVYYYAALWPDELTKREERDEEIRDK